MNQFCLSSEMVDQSCSEKKNSPRRRNTFSLTSPAVAYTDATFRPFTVAAHDNRFGLAIGGLDFENR